MLRMCWLNVTVSLLCSTFSPLSVIGVIQQQKIIIFKLIIVVRYSPVTFMIITNDVERRGKKIKIVEFCYCLPRTRIKECTAGKECFKAFSPFCSPILIQIMLAHHFVIL